MRLRRWGGAYSAPHPKLVLRGLLRHREREGKGGKGKGGEGKGKRRERQEGRGRWGRGGEVDSGAQLEQGRRLAEADPAPLCHCD